MYICHLASWLGVLLGDARIPNLESRTAQSSSTSFKVKDCVLRNTPFDCFDLIEPSSMYQYASPLAVRNFPIPLVSIFVEEFAIEAKISMAEC